MESVDRLWLEIEPSVTNRVKIAILNRHADAVLSKFNAKLDSISKRYAKHLPLHVAESERDDLKTIAQLELLETLKVWLPSRNRDFWPLAQARIIGAMKDHIRYISKSDPSRFYDWITDAAYVYMAINDRADFQDTIENGIQLTDALRVLTPRERDVVLQHTKDDLTFRQIGESIGVSESQVSRIYKKSIEKIQKKLNSRLPT